MCAQWARRQYAHTFLTLGECSLVINTDTRAARCHNKHTFITAWEATSREKLHNQYSSYFLLAVPLSWFFFSSSFFRIYILYHEFVRGVVRLQVKRDGISQFVGTVSNTDWHDTSSAHYFILVCFSLWSIFSSVTVCLVTTGRGSGK